jgi:nucleoside-diphosphate-sugar epimerase
MSNLLSGYRGAKVLITGGLGFIGNNLALELVKVGAQVTLTDSNYSDDWRDIVECAEKVSFEVADIRNRAKMEKLISDKDYLFNLAGLSGAVESNQDPMQHLDVNCAGQLNILEVCRSTNSEIRVFFPSSQLVYGSVQTNPVAETAYTKPKCMYGINKLAVEHYYRLYHDLYGLRSSILRMSNPYGPRQTGEHSYGVVNNFVIRAITGKPITIFGDGLQVRDYIYIDDAVEAILIAAASENAYGKIYNVGGEEPIALADMARLIVELLGTGEVKFIPWPEEAKNTEVGSIFLDKSKIKKELDWVAKVSLVDGLKKTIDYYARELSFELRHL